MDVLPGNPNDTAWPTVVVRETLLAVGAAGGDWPVSTGPLWHS